MAISTEKFDRQTDAEVAGLREEVRALTGSMKALQAQVEQQARTIADLSARVGATPAHDAGVAPVAEEEIGPEALAIITAAVTAFLGKKVRIRSARRLQSPYEIINPWSQQGRVSVQASHALRWLE
jgi:hypothetical protein